MNNFFRDLSKQKTLYGQQEFVPQKSPLPKEVDVVVIGGGLLGLSSALSLLEGGLRVAVLEAKNSVDGPSGRSGGQMWPGFEMSLFQMQKKFGEEPANILWRMVHETLSLVHRRMGHREDRCDFFPGLALLSKTKKQEKKLTKEFSVLKRVGLGRINFLQKEDVKKYVSSAAYHNGILFLGEEGNEYGHLNPRKYVESLSSLVVTEGGLVFENTPALEVVRQIEGGYIVRTPLGEVAGKNIIFATGADYLKPKGDVADSIPRAYIQVQTIILATEKISKDLAYEIIPGNICFADASDTAMNYVRLITDPEDVCARRLLFGGADSLMQVASPFAVMSLKKQLYEIFPQLKREKVAVDIFWGGNCDLSRNSLPFLLEEEGLFCAAGFSGQGVVLTALYGKVMAEKILGKHNGEFEMLKKLTPEMYSDTYLIALFQGAKRLLMSK